MSDLVTESHGGANAGDGFEALATLNDGILGTGQTTAVEVSYIVLGLIAVYVAYSTARYFVSGRSLVAVVAETLGFR